MTSCNKWVARGRPTQQHDGGVTVLENSVLWRRLDSIRLKVTDKCTFRCQWCHNEGSGVRDPQIVRDMQWDAVTKSCIEALVHELDLSEVHLTGGEPTANRRLPAITSGLTGLGLKVKMTSAGCNEKTLREVTGNGLRDLNFSLNAVTGPMLHSTQIHRTEEWAERMVAQQLGAILLAAELGATVQVNTVLANTGDIRRVRQVFDWARRKNIRIRIMNELSSGDTADRAIEQFLRQIDAVKIRTVYTTASSAVSTYYQVADKYTFVVKGIRDNYLDQSMCSLCMLRHSRQCSEHFYGIRLEKRVNGTARGLYVRLCIHRMDSDTLLPIDVFLRSEQLAEIKQQMNSSRRHMQEENAKRLA